MPSACSATPAPRRSPRSGAAPVASQLRADINAGGSSFCGDCPLKLPLAPDEAPPQRDLDVSGIPGRLYIEMHRRL